MHICNKIYVLIITFPSTCFSALAEDGAISAETCRRVILVGDQLNAQFLLLYVYISSTCFEQLYAHPQEDNCMNTTCGIITVC